MSLITMKFWIIGFLLFVSLRARSEESMCAALFHREGPPQELKIETDLSLLARDYFLNVGNGKEASQQPADLQNKTPEINAAYFNMVRLSAYKSRNRPALTKKEKTEISNRFYHVLTGIILTSSEQLKQSGIKHTLKYNSMRPIIVISTDGDHYVNRTAKRLKDKYGLEIVIDPFESAKGASAGSYRPSKTGNPQIRVSPVVLNKEFFQNDVLLHEFTHSLDFEADYRGHLKPYHGSVKIKDKLSELDIYGDAFSIDEIRAHRTSLRSFAHKAVLAKNESNMDYFLNTIKKRIKMEILFSSATKTAVEEQIKYHSDSDQPDRKFEILDSDNNPKTVGLPATYEMASFTGSLFELLSKELSFVEKKSFADKKIFIKKLIKVLTIPSVRKMEGIYPPIDEIKKILNTNDQEL
jgi:hypothetical protein